MEIDENHPLGVFGPPNSESGCEKFLRCTSEVDFSYSSTKKNYVRKFGRIMFKGFTRRFGWKCHLQPISFKLRMWQIIESLHVNFQKKINTVVWPWNTRYKGFDRNITSALELKISFLGLLSIQKIFSTILTPSDKSLMVQASF